MKNSIEVKSEFTLDLQRLLIIGIMRAFLIVLLRTAGGVQEDVKAKW